ncbi:MAG: hypothetical protein JJE39_10515 [Vicinamibacteria bacterium]|nr:hypothetical protein [Vicinamibacteria bacterium]
MAVARAEFDRLLGYYMSDLTRMMPVNGRFSPSQRELSGFYLVCYKSALKAIRPDATAQAILIITATGIGVVSDFVPMEIEAIEKLMTEEGMLQRHLKDDVETRIALIDANRGFPSPDYS